MKTLNIELPVYYQGSTKNNNNPFQVTVIELKGKTATVKSHGETPEEFKCKVSSLYN